MSKSIRYALKIMNYLATSPMIDRMGLRKSIEKFTYFSAKASYRVRNKAATKTKRNKVKGAQDLALRLEHMPFDLSYSEEQQIMQASVQKFAAQQLRNEAHEADNQSGIDEVIHRVFAELGIHDLTVPEVFGGVAQEHQAITQMLIHQNLAYGDLSISLALLSSISVANALTRWGSEQQKQHYLPQFLATVNVGFKATIALQEPHALFDPLQLTTTAQRSAKHFILNGQKSMVAIAQQANLFLVAAKLNNKSNGIFLLPADTPGLSIRLQSSMGLKAAGICSLQLKNVKLSRHALLGENSKTFNYLDFLNYGRLAWCAFAVGSCEAVRDYVIQYCNEREAFGEPISHRQAIAFKIADMAIEIDSMKLLMQRAVARAEKSLPFQRETYLAKLLCNEKSMQIATDGVQLLGGHGFTKEHPVERWYRDLRAIAIMDSGLHL